MDAWDRLQRFVHRPASEPRQIQRYIVPSQSAQFGDQLVAASERDIGLLGSDLDACELSVVAETAGKESQVLEEAFTGVDASQTIIGELQTVLHAAGEAGGGGFGCSGEPAIRGQFANLRFGQSRILEGGRDVEFHERSHTGAIVGGVICVITAQDVGDAYVGGGCSDQPEDLLLAVVAAVGGVARDGGVSEDRDRLYHMRRADVSSDIVGVSGFSICEEFAVDGDREHAIGSEGLDREREQEAAIDASRKCDRNLAQIGQLGFARGEFVLDVHVVIVGVLIQDINRRLRWWTRGGTMTPMATRKPRTRIDRFAQRRRGLLRFLGKQGLGAAVVSRPEDVSYLTGFEGGDASVFLAEGVAVLVVGALYLEEAQAMGGASLEVRAGSMGKQLPDLLRGRRIRRLAAQSDVLTHQQWGALDAAVGGRTLVELVGLVDELRLTKDAQELAIMRQAIKAAETAFRELTARGRCAFVGRTEHEIATELDHRMRQAGAAGPSFETIVAAGPGTSQPHYRPGSRVIERGDPVLIDWGALVKGYCSDLTRVVFTGKIPPIFATIYPIVARAQQEAMRAIKPGVSAGRIDAAARDVIVQAGYGEQFIHTTGHGLGRQVHEMPPIARANTWRLRVGTVFTVEPGIYIPGVGGVRIEDDMVVTGSGRRKLSTLPVAIETMVLR
jgi:Xaa-Pro aminopeptidase